MKFREFRYVSNILSTTRIVLAAPIYYLLNLKTTAASHLAVAVMLLAALTDALDGWLARRLQQKSDLGRVLDPVADKVCMGILAFVLVKEHNLPPWFLALILSRDAAILILGLMLTVRTKEIVESNMLGKVTVSALALTFISYTLKWEWAKTFLLWCSVVLMLASSIVYIRKLMKLTRPAGIKQDGVEKVMANEQEE
ncbi:MAG: CDP-alcohol phosphatidyltransferase family protein [bacterium]